MTHCPPNIKIDFNKERNLSVKNSYYFKTDFIEAKPAYSKESTHDWPIEQNVEWSNPKKQYSDHVVLNINQDIKLNVPVTSRFLIPIFEKAKYILELKEDWDDNGALPYSNEVWKTSAKFLIQYYGWLSVNAKGSIHTPQIHHGPNGSIDIAWHEDNIRLFININATENCGTFYCDTPNKQYSEGQFLLNNIKFHLIPTPYKY